MALTPGEDAARRAIEAARAAEVNLCEWCGHVNDTDGPYCSERCRQECGEDRHQQYLEDVVEGR